jgi:cytochrome P450
MVVQETLRLYPPVPWFGRKAAADVEIGGHGVAAGSLLLVSPHTLHRDPRFWDAPEAFRPERFDPGRGGATWAYLPFGGGPRTCIGNRFAAVEMVTALAVLAPLFDVEPVARGPIPGRALVTLRPAGGLLARVAPRPPVP